MAHDSAAPRPTPSSPLVEELVAYLDGELNAEACRRVEERLATDAEARQTLHELEQTWQLLDELGRATVDEAFTLSTMEMVAVAAEGEVRQLTSSGARVRWWLLRVGGLVAAAALGFLAVVLWRPDPNRQLLQELPVLENLYEYRQIGDIEFLRQLDQQGLFVKEDDDGN